MEVDAPASPGPPAAADSCSAHQHGFTTSGKSHCVEFPLTGNSGSMLNPLKRCLSFPSIDRGSLLGAFPSGNNNTIHAGNGDNVPGIVEAGGNIASQSGPPLEPHPIVPVVEKRNSFSPSSASLSGQSYPPIDRTRRFSTSAINIHQALQSPTAFGRFSSRLDQIRLEERLGQADREVAHEKETQSAMIISNTWDDLSLEDGVLDEEGGARSPTGGSRPRPKSFTEPLHVFTTSPFHASSPSPTRLLGGKQLFSPSLQQTVRSSGGYTPSPTPSPTRRCLISRRSISPIVFRPSPLSAVKRKIEVDSHDMGGGEGCGANPYKKLRAASFSCGSSSSSGILGENPTSAHYQPLMLSVTPGLIPGSSGGGLGGLVPHSNHCDEGSDTAMRVDEPPNASWPPTAHPLRLTPSDTPSWVGASPASHVSPLSSQSGGSPWSNPGGNPPPEGLSGGYSWSGTPPIWPGVESMEGGGGDFVGRGDYALPRSSLSPRFTFQPVRDSDSGRETENSSDASPGESMKQAFNQQAPQYFKEHADLE